MRPEIANWIKQALADAKTAKDCLTAGNHYACAFFAHQSVEKALKALFILRFKTAPPKIHDLLKLAKAVKMPKDLQNVAADLTSEAVTTRYPDIAGGTPAELYHKDKALRVLKSARRLLRWLYKRLK
ncbi:MAG: HEPN domain-containing protein [Candidatus Aenigmarchaeota archaeon]|nr:HEPN domain-containing protein [Candidatus Aenigmarchaeota archaeon]